MKKVLSLALAAAMALSLAACGGGNNNGGNAGGGSNGGAASNGGGAASSTPATAPSGDLITVGVINNDPNESGYRTANDAAMRATFTEENGYKATFYNNNDAAQQIAEAQQMVQNEVDFLLLSPASTTHGKDGDVIVMGFDSDKWAFEAVLEGSWNYMGLCNPLQADTVDTIIKDLAAGKQPSQKIIYTPEQGFDCDTLTQADVDKYGT